MVESLDVLVLQSRQPSRNFGAAKIQEEHKLKLPLKKEAEVEEAEDQLNRDPECQVWLVS